jgi:type IV pilus assembly protein PilW
LRHQQGVSIVEFLVASTIFLLLALGAYAVLDYGKRVYTKQEDLARMQKDGRAALELMVNEIRMAGYNPLGIAFVPLPTTTSTTVRILADLDEDGVVGTSTEANENVTYRWIDTDGDGVGRIERGVDFNGDGDFSDGGEYVETIADFITRTDADGDTELDDFFQFDHASPHTTTVLVTFAARSRHKDPDTGQYETLDFYSNAHLRNALPF